MELDDTGREHYPPKPQHFDLARNETTPERVLTILWRQSRSIKVRKEIAKNPNSSPKVLQEAARLYLEEVLENPNFELFELFDEDPWVKTLSTCLRDPTSFFATTRISKYHRITPEQDQYLWACLLSRNITPASLDKTLSFISTAKMRRALKNPQVVERIRTTYLQSVQKNKSSLPFSCDFSFETMFIMYRNNLITAKDLREGLTGFGFGFSYFPKADFGKFMKKAFADYHTQSANGFVDEEIPKLLATVFMVCKKHILGWIPYTCLISSSYAPKGLEIYTKIVKFINNVHLSKNQGSKILPGRVEYFGRLIGNSLYGKFFYNLPYTEQGKKDRVKGLNEVYKYVVDNGLMDVALKSFQFCLPGKKYYEALEECDINVKEFYVRIGALGVWTSPNTDPLHYKIINDVNNTIYDKVGFSNKLIFDSCSISKIISIMRSTHVLL